MNPMDKDAGVIFVLLERFNKQRYPMVLELKKKLDAGEPISDYDVEFLERVLSEARDLEPLVDHHPEYCDLVTSVFSLYAAIAKRVVENERKQTNGGHLTRHENERGTGQ